MEGFWEGVRWGLRVMIPLDIVIYAVYSELPFIG